MGTTTEERRRRGGTLAAGIAALALVSGLVVRTSAATFTAQTANTGNQLEAGNVVLQNAASGVLFNVTAMEPGQTEVRCIRVTYTGSIPDPGTVRVYGGGYTDNPSDPVNGQGLSPYLDVTINEGTGGGTDGDCTNFTPGTDLVTAKPLATFNVDHNSYANGLVGWDVSATPQDRTYRITLQLDTATPNVEQNSSTTGIAFVWEVQTDG